MVPWDCCFYYRFSFWHFTCFITLVFGGLNVSKGTFIYIKLLHKVSLWRVSCLTHSLLCFVVSAVHFCSYKEKFISLYCRLSAVIELDFLSTQQSLREAILDSEVAAAKQRHQQVLDYIQVTVCFPASQRWFLAGAVIWNLNGELLGQAQHKDV